VIWGITVHFPDYIKLMETSGIKVLGVVNARPEVSKDYMKYLKSTDIKVISPDEISVKTPVVCTFLGEDEKTLFFDCLKFCKERGLRFIHPAAALMNLEYPEPITPKVKSFGLQGAGNVLVQQFIYDFLPKREQTPEEIFYSFLAFRYYASLNDAMEGALSSFGIFKNEVSGLSHGFYGFSMFGESNSSKAQVTFYGHPLLNFAWDQFVGDHGIPSKRSIEFFKKKKFKPILVTRHPLDISRKYMGLQQQFSKFHLQNMLTFYHHASKNKDDLYTIKYEDILLNPIETLGGLSDYIGFKVTPEEIEQWWEKHKFRLLPRAPGSHFKGGGIDKWKQCYTKKQFKVLQDYGIIDLANKMGYIAEESDLLDEEFFDERLFDVDELDVCTIEVMAIYWSVEPGQYLETPQGNKLYYYCLNCSIKNEELSKSTLLLDLVDSVFLEKPHPLDYTD
jgi:hypothetical protein